MEMSFPQDMEILIKWQLEKSVSREIMVKNHYNKLIFFGKKGFLRMDLFLRMDSSIYDIIRLLLKMIILWLLDINFIPILSK